MHMRTIAAATAALGLWSSGALAQEWGGTIGVGYDMLEGTAGDSADDDFSLVLGLVFEPNQQPISYYADFQLAEYDLTSEIVDFFEADDGYIRRFSLSTGVQWNAPTKGPLGFYANAGIAGHYLDFNLTEVGIIGGIVCDPWWWWCVPVAGVGDVIVDSESTTRLGYSIGLGADLEMGGGGKLFLEARNNWVNLEETIRYFSVMFGYRW